MTGTIPLRRDRIALNAIQWINVKADPADPTSEDLWRYADPAFRSEYPGVLAQIREAGFPAVMMEVLATQTLQDYARMIAESGLALAPGYASIGIPSDHGLHLPPGSEDRMRLVHRLADRNHRENTGGPFAAVVSDAGTGEILSVGVNLVLAFDLSCLHAEVVAISLAQARLGTWDLGSRRLELAVNWRPCAMCYGATLWSGVTRLVVAGEGDILEELTGFDEGPMRDDWKEQFTRRGIDVRTDVLRDEAIAVFRAYGERSDTTVYNGRRDAGS